MVERHNILVEGVRISYLEKRSPKLEAPSMVFLHGLTATAETYIHLMESLGEDHRLIALDLPGTDFAGRAADGDASLAAMARTVSLTLGQLGLERPILVGHSHGGAIALQIAAQTPDSLRGLVLLSPAHPDSPHSDLLIRFYLTPPGKLFAHALPWLPRRVQLAGFRRMAGPGSWTDPRQLEPYRANLKASGTVAHLLRLLGTWKQDMAELRLLMQEPIRVPTLLIWGDHDRAVPVATAKDLHPHLRFWHLFTLPKVGHRPAEEAPRECAALIKQWEQEGGICGLRIDANEPPSQRVALRPNSSPSH